MTRSESEIRRELETVERYAEQVQRRLDAILGQRDELLAELLDLDGAASDRFVAAR